MNKKISFKEINKLAIPAIFAGIVEPVISITDTAVAGRLQTDTVEALAGVGLVGAFLSTLIWIFAQTRSAVSAFVSQAYGANKLNRIHSLFSQIFWMNFLISILLLAVSYFFVREIFELYTAKGVALDYCEEYYKIRVWGFPLTLLTFTIFGLFRGLQNTSWAMIIGIIGGVTNIVLDYILALYLDWHVVGIAYASLIAQGVMFILALIFLFRKTSFHLKTKLSIHQDMPKTLYMTLNLVARTTSLNIALFLANRYATSYGDAYIDTQSILMQIWLLSAFILDGYSNAGNAISGRLLGAKDFNRLWKLGLDLAKSMTIVSLILMVIYFLGYDKIANLFAPKQSEIQKLFNNVFWVVIVMQPINAMAFLFDGIYKGLGEASRLRNLLLLATFIGFIPTLFILDALHLRLYAIWGAFFIWMLIRAGGLLYSFHKTYKPTSYS